MKYWIGYDLGDNIQLLNWVNSDFPGGFFHGGRLIDTEEEARKTMRRLVAPAGTDEKELHGRWSQEEAAKANLRIIPVPDEAYSPLKAVTDEARAIDADDIKHRRHGNDTRLFKEGRRLREAGEAAEKVLMAAMRDAQCIPAGAA